MKKTTGQSILEYCFIAIIVILGIVIMGPYVLRSIDAHFKMWDEGARDSFSETIQQAPVSAVPDITTNCSCPASQGSCGSAQAGPNGCGPTEREWDYNCTPQGCNGAEGSFYCVNDPACCIDQPQGCGGVTCPAGGCNLGPSPPAQGNDCYYGYEKIANVCGSSVSNNLGTTESETTCTSNSSCLPICKGITSAQQDNISAGFAAPCPGSPGTPAGTTPLLQNEDVTFVQTQNQQTGSTDWCSSGTACQYYCTNGAWDPANPGVCAKSCTINVVYPTTADCGGNCYGGSNYDGCGTAAGGLAEMTAMHVCLAHGYRYLVGFLGGCCSGGSGSVFIAWLYTSGPGPVNNTTDLTQFGGWYPMNPGQSSGDRNFNGLNTVYCANGPGLLAGAGAPRPCGALYGDSSSGCSGTAEMQCLGSGPYCNVE